MAGSVERNAINIKHGYQIGDKAVGWFLGKFLDGDTHDPLAAYEESRSAFEAGNYPILALTSSYFSVGDYMEAVEGSLTLVPAEPMLDLLRKDYRSMIESGLLFDLNAESFEKLMERCGGLETRANESASAAPRKK